jgi:hypothetical protein
VLHVQGWQARYQRRLSQAAFPAGMKKQDHELDQRLRPRSTNLTSLAAISALSTPAIAQQKPNIVFILTDNLGYGEVGAYGGGETRGAATPNIDSIAREGLRLTNMNMETQCTPSRSSILTGRYSIRSGTYAVPFGGVEEGLTQWEDHGRSEGRKEPRSQSV